MVDVGAYEGAVASDYLDHFPEAVCHALEPHPPSFRALADRLGAHPRARIHRLALGDTPGRSTLHAFPTAATNSLLAPLSGVDVVVGPGHMDSFERVDVDVTTLDLFAEQEGVSRIDLLKLDVQGAELLVRGAERLLRARAIGLVVTEVNFVQVYRAQASYYDVAAALQSVGYRLYDFYNFHYGSGGQLQWGTQSSCRSRTRDAHGTRGSSVPPHVRSDCTPRDCRRVETRGRRHRILRHRRGARAQRGANDAPRIARSAD